jgi:hypothetical protein
VSRSVFDNNESTPTTNHSIKLTRPSRGLVAKISTKDLIVRALGTTHTGVYCLKLTPPSLNTAAVFVSKNQLTEFRELKNPLLDRPYYRPVHRRPPKYQPEQS